MSPRPPRIVVIGGGINGLAAGWSAWLASGSGSARVCVLEAAPEVGGKARTRHSEGWLLEEGPTGFLSGEETLERLIQLAGLEPLPARSEAARRYVIRGGKVREIKANPLAFGTSGILSARGLLRLAREPWVPRGSAADESIWDFAARRLGHEVADRLIAPMVLGIFSGDAHQLSLPSALPRMAEMESEHGSLIRAMLQLRRDKKSASGGPAGPAGNLSSFAEGMQSLPLALAERAPFDVRCQARVEALQRDPQSGAWRVHVSGDPEALLADEVILSCDAHTSSRLLRPVLPAVADELAAISIPGMAVVGLAYDNQALSRGRSFPTGFGVLIPRGEGGRTIGCLFDSQLFEGRSPAGQSLVRCMIGGASDPGAGAASEQELIETSIADVARLFGVQQTPVSRGCIRYREAIPQYELGHAERLLRIDQAILTAGPGARGLNLAGCHAAGVAFGKTAREGWRVGELAGQRCLEMASGRPFPEARE